jgi:TP901-1 family phage major tail protein
MMSFNGADLLLLANTGTPEAPTYEAVGSQRDVTIDEASETIDFSSKDARERAVGHGRYSSDISLDSLYVPNDEAYAVLKASMRNGTLILVAREEEDVVIETAEAQVNSLSETFPDQDAATVSIGIAINGAWTPVGS